jgi:hypothetical protein
MFGPKAFPPNNLLKRKRGENQEEIDEVSLFRRVRIYNVIEGLALPNPQRSEVGYPVKVRIRKAQKMWEDRKGQDMFTSHSKIQNSR